VTTSNGGNGSAAALYLPTELDPEFNPGVEDMDYAQRFSDLARVFEHCERPEQAVLFASTCRNQWLTTNAAFVDLRDAIGGAALPSRVSRGLYELRRGNPGRAERLFREALALMAQLRAKLQCWMDREFLLSDIEQAMESLDDNIARDRSRAWLRRQRFGPPTTGPSDQARYLALDTQENARCSEPLGLMREAERRLTVALRVALDASLLVAAVEAIDTSAAAEQDDSAARLFEIEEVIGESQAPPDSEAGWQRLLGQISKDPGALTAALHEDPAGETILRFANGSELLLPSSAPDSKSLTEVLNVLIDLCEAVVEWAREAVLDRFSANTAEPPMPSPFVIDLSPHELQSGERTRNFQVTRADGRCDSVPDRGRLALLECGMPEDAYSHTRKELYVYDRDQAEGARKAKEIICAAIDAAAARDAAFLAIPEVFVPREALPDLTVRAERANLGLIAGLEYPERLGGAVNEALIAVPGLMEPLFQRKQGPSVYEIRDGAFDHDQRLWFIRRTALGNLAVILCSDFLELDLLWAVAQVDERVDVVVVCSRNRNPEVFERLAIADAARLHAYIAVVNAYPPRRAGQPASGHGTLVAQPRLEQPALHLDRTELPISWEGRIAPPCVAFAELEVAAIRERDTERAGAHGYLRPPRFARWQPDATLPNVGDHSG
jgi:hypothetical protein